MSMVQQRRIRRRKSKIGIQKILDNSESHFKTILRYISLNENVGNKPSSYMKVINFGFGERNNREEGLIEFSEAN